MALTVDITDELTGCKTLFKLIPAPSLAWPDFFTNVIPQIGQSPGWSSNICGCIGQVYFTTLFACTAACSFFLSEQAVSSIILSEMLLNTMLIAFIFPLISNL